MLWWTNNDKSKCSELLLTITFKLWPGFVGIFSCSIYSTCLHLHTTLLQYVYTILIWWRVCMCIDIFIHSFIVHINDKCVKLWAWTMQTFIREWMSNEKRVKWKEVRYAFREEREGEKRIWNESTHFRWNGFKVWTRVIFFVIIRTSI